MTENEFEYFKLARWLHEQLREINLDPLEELHV